MHNYISNLLPRILAYSSRMSKEELIVEKIFHLLNDNNEIHQYTFLRGGELVLSINGIMPSGNLSWRLLPTGQLFIDRGKDRITLDFDFLHPEVLIMKMGGTQEMPFIIFNKTAIPDCNVFKYLKLFEAKKTNTKVYMIDEYIYNEIELGDVILNINGNPFSGEIYSNEYELDVYNRELLIQDVVKYMEGKCVNTDYIVKYKWDEYQLPFKQIDKYQFTIGDKFLGDSSNRKIKSLIDRKQIYIENETIYFDDEQYIFKIKKDRSVEYLLIGLVSFVALLILAGLLFSK